jgi:hypothetical protein
MGHIDAFWSKPDEFRARSIVGEGDIQKHDILNLPDIMEYSKVICPDTSQAGHLKNLKITIIIIVLNTT